MRALSIKTLLMWLMRLLTIAVLVTMLGVVYVHKIEPRWLDVAQVRLTLPNLPAEFDGYRIVQLTDIHADGWMTPNRLQRIVKTVNRQQPDIVALTGDFITGHAERYAPTLKVFEQLKPKERSLAVLGNHDHWDNAGLIALTLAQSGVDVLGNTVHTVERGKAQLHIAGVDDVWAGKARLDQVLQILPNTGAAVLLVHEPDFADTSAATGRFDLQLSGHSHGGQVSLPFLGQPVLPPYGKKYPSGKYQVGSMIQYTSRGIGMVKPRIRFNCRPEITVLTLKAMA